MPRAVNSDLPFVEQEVNKPFITYQGQNDEFKQAFCRKARSLVELIRPESIAKCGNDDARMGK